MKKENLTDGLNLWLWNEALYEDLCKLERAFTDGADPAEVVFQQSVLCEYPVPESRI